MLRTRTEARSGGRTPYCGLFSPVEASPVWNWRQQCIVDGG